MASIEVWASSRYSCRTRPSALPIRFATRTGAAQAVPVLTVWSMSVQPIIAGAMHSRIWEIYRDQFAVLVGTALALFAALDVVRLHPRRSAPANGDTWPPTPPAGW